MKLSEAQRRLLRQLAEGHKIIRRGTTLDSNPRLFVKAINGKERPVAYATLLKLQKSDAVSYSFTLTASGRAEAAQCP